MEENTLRKNMWNTAGVAGLALGGVSILYLVYSHLVVDSSNLQQEPSTFIAILSYIVWALKIFGCIFLMNFFMKKFFSENRNIDRSVVFKMGMAAAILSALVYSSAYLLDMMYISNEYYDAVISQAIDQMRPFMDKNASNNINGMLSILPKVTFIFNLGYCFIYGTVLSAILSRKFPPKNYFVCGQ